MRAQRDYLYRVAKNAHFGIWLPLGGNEIPKWVNWGSKKVDSATLEGFDELGQNLVHVANDSEVSNSEDRRFLVLVDGDDVL